MTSVALWLRQVLLHASHAADAALACRGTKVSAAAAALAVPRQQA